MLSFRDQPLEQSVVLQAAFPSQHSAVLTWHVLASHGAVFELREKPNVQSVAAQVGFTVQQKSVSVGHDAAVQ